MKNQNQLTNERIVRIEAQIIETSQFLHNAMKEISSADASKENADHLGTLMTNLSVLKVKADFFRRMIEKRMTWINKP